MTRQIPEYIYYDGEKYMLSRFCGTGLFHPDKFGIKVSWIATCCWRGFQCTYVIRRDALYVDEVRVRFADEETDPPKLYGMHAQYESELKLHVYRDPPEVVPYTGGVLIERFVGQDKVLRELIFDNGRLTKSLDHSDAMRELEERIRVIGRRVSGYYKRRWEITQDVERRNFELTRYRPFPLVRGPNDPPV